MKNKQNKRRGHLGRKVSIVVACLLIVSILVIVEVCISMFRSHTMDMLRDQCVSGTNVLAYQLEHSSGLTDKTELLDDLKDQMGCEFTIFEGNERAYTTIVQGGKRAVGTKLSTDLAETVLERGNSYVGNADILGVEHLCSYVPTRNASGEVDGLIFAGISMETASKQINNTLTTSAVVGAVLIFVSLIFLTLFIRNSVSRPLSQLTGLAHTMEQGDLGLNHARESVSFRFNDEIGFLGQTFDNTMDRLNGYIGEIAHVLESIAAGDLTADIRMEYVGDFVSIRESLQGILVKLNQTMSQIIESTDFVSDGAEQLAFGATALSQGAVEQASSVEDLDRNIQTISDQVQQTAENALHANEKVETVSEQITESNLKMQEMIQAMEDINHRSSEIEKIIKTIENISAQTNILALNATVEAARAGAAGKGFAVVAEEVRELATKSAEASQTTNDLIRSSIDAVERGTKIANETASQLSSAVSGAGEIVDVTNRIAAAASDQAESVSQIRVQTSQISQVVQTNSATAQESAATSQQLSHQANLLRDLIRTFRLSARH